MLRKKLAPIMPCKWIQKSIPLGLWNMHMYWMPSLKPKDWRRPCKSRIVNFVTECFVLPDHEPLLLIQSGQSASDLLQFNRS